MIKKKYQKYLFIIGTISAISITSSSLIIYNVFNQEQENPPPYVPPDNPPADPPISEIEIDAIGTVYYIYDGDTYNQTGSDINCIRLADIDCNESGDPGYQEAKDYLTDLIYGKLVYLDIDDIYGTDFYGRLVGVVYVRYNSTHCLNVNKAMLMSGYAVIDNYDNEFNPYSWKLLYYHE